ncbi:MAG: hypothetical protein EPO40_19545 [Myxococcaceae bacterium]|nr:MAG: hypothetical protein EPO40_19545 [Myxococcaceae bacterium]
MSISGASASFSNQSLGNPQQLDLPPAVAGCCSAGTAAVPTLVANADALVAAFGYGPMCEAAATLLDLAGGPIVVCKVATAAAGAFTGLAAGVVPDPATLMGVSPMVCTPSGTPRDAYTVWVKVTRAGATLEALTAMVRISLDGGTTYGAETPVPSSGVVVIPNTGITLTWSDNTDADQLYLNDIYIFGSTAPTWDTTGLAAALAACQGVADTLDHEFVHVVGPVTGLTFPTVSTAADNLIAASIPRWILIETRDQSNGEAEATWVGVLEGASPGFAGLTNNVVVKCSAFATQASRLMPATWRRPLAWLLSPRIATIPVSQHPGRVRTGAIAGIVTLHHDFASSTLLSLDAQGFLGAQSIRGRSGYFATDRSCAATGTDFTSVMRVRTICYAARVALAAATDFINEDNDTGDNGVLSSSAADAFDQSVDSALQRELIDRKFVSTASARVNRTDDVLTTETLRFKLRFRPRNYAKTITLDLGFTRE